ncbi:UDP-glucoronosyl/UDP-glucosyl transferase [Arcicella aurantiaca]|uniref:UDP-glucoronosyl/UDP-glucosyl transferase n=1 Tax=Arcicella aurantiaca TaxID=591202 RepID=A0A316DHH0_9BACT|nr:glycosyltransferase [Arcicella aurantiaca]PWK16679.1 UDP-glucoronosyl/UDP-glucosyl transferase [Arcicella aurantiaca]
MPSTYKVGSYPLVSETVWSEKRNILKNTDKSKLKQFLKSPKVYIFEYLKQKNIDNLFKISRITDKNKKIDNDFIFAFDNIPELVLVPLEFEYSKEIRKGFQHYLGLSQRIENRQDTELDPHFADNWNSILKQKESGKKIIYCSFGTYFEGADPRLLDFVNVILESVSNIPNTILICSVNKFIVEVINSQHITLKNAYFFSRVPQLKVLEVSDLFITHGGMGGIKESIYYKVPMLVFPLDLHYDQSGNALKVEIHGLGLRGTFGFERSKDMQTKITRLLEEESFKEKLTALKHQTDNYYTENYFKNLFNQLLQ